MSRRPSDGLPLLSVPAERGSQLRCEGHPLRKLDCGHTACDTCLSDLESQSQGCFVPCEECDKSGGSTALDIFVPQPGEVRCFRCHGRTTKYNSLCFCLDCKELFHFESGCLREQHDEVKGGDEHTHIWLADLPTENNDLYRKASRRFRRMKRSREEVLNRMKGPIDRFSIQLKAYKEGKIKWYRLVGEVFVSCLLSALDFLVIPVSITIAAVSGPVVCFAKAMKKAQSLWNKPGVGAKIKAFFTAVFGGIFGLALGAIYGYVELGPDLCKKGMDWFGEQVAKALPTVPSDDEQAMTDLMDNALMKFCVRNLDQWDVTKLNNRYEQLVVEALDNEDPESNIFTLAMQKEILKSHLRDA